MRISIALLSGAIGCPMNHAALSDGNPYANQETGAPEGFHRGAHSTLVDRLTLQ
jgi:hypothetical protein